MTAITDPTVINAVTACQLLKFVDFYNVVGEPGLLDDKRSQK